MTRKRGRKFSPQRDMVHATLAGISKHPRSRGTPSTARKPRAAPGALKPATTGTLWCDTGHISLLHPLYPPSGGTPSSSPPAPEHTGLLLYRPRGPTVPLLPTVSASGRQHKALVLPPPPSGTGVLVPARAPSGQPRNRRPPRGRGRGHFAGDGNNDLRVCPTTPTHSFETPHRRQPAAVSSTADASEGGGKDTARSTGSTVHGTTKQDVPHRVGKKQSQRTSHGHKKAARGKENRAITAPAPAKVSCAAEASSPSLGATPPAHAVLQPVVENTQAARVPPLRLVSTTAQHGTHVIEPD